MTKKECFNCHNIKEGLTIDWLDRESREHVEFCCWDCSENIIQKELDEKTADWERNKKKIFRETLQKVKNKEEFEWPWRERRIEDMGEYIWDRITTVCPQCQIVLHWDVTPYQDSQGHKCSQCRNCREQIKSGEQKKHFTWKDDNTASYICPRGEYKEGEEMICYMCDTSAIHKKGIYKGWLSDQGGSVFSYLNIRPNSKGHANIITKNHVENLRKLSPQQWADILPVLKDSVNKYTKVQQMAGYLISIPVGRLGNQTSPHFYTRLIPKYKKDWGEVGRIMGKRVTPEVAEKIRNGFQPATDNIIAEKSKVIARLHDEIGTIAISTKEHLSGDINAIDQETWLQFLQMLQELMEKCEAKFDCHDFAIKAEVGEKAFKIWKEELNMPLSYAECYRDSEFVINMFPRFDLKRWWKAHEGRPIENGKQVGSMENERIAEKLRDPETYYARWKGDRNYLKNKGRSLTYSEREREREISKVWVKIKDLEQIPNRTPEQEQELQNKKAELARLEAQLENEKRATNWTPWISLGITLTIILGISAYLLAKEKIRKNKFN